MFSGTTETVFKKVKVRDNFFQKLFKLCPRRSLLLSCPSIDQKHFLPEMQVAAKVNKTFPTIYKLQRQIPFAALKFIPIENKINFLH